MNTNKQSVYKVLYLPNKKSAYAYFEGRDDYKWKTAKVTANSREEARKIVLNNNPDWEVLSIVK